MGHGGVESSRGNAVSSIVTAAGGASWAVDLLGASLRQL